MLFIIIKKDIELSFVYQRMKLENEMRELENEIRE